MNLPSATVCPPHIQRIVSRVVSESFCENSARADANILAFAQRHHTVRRHLRETKTFWLFTSAAAAVAFFLAPLVSERLIKQDEPLPSAVTVASGRAAPVLDDLIAPQFVYFNETPEELPLANFEDFI